MTHAREMMIQQRYRRDQGYLPSAVSLDGLSQVRARVRIQIAFQETSDVLEGVYMPPDLRRLGESAHHLVFVTRKHRVDIFFGARSHQTPEVPRERGRVSQE